MERAGRLAGVFADDHFCRGRAFHAAQTLAGSFPTVLLYCLTLYITSAWDIWWYGGSLGRRARWCRPIRCGVLPWPLFLGKDGCRNKTGGAGFLSAMAGACVYLNLWWSYQAHRGGLFVSEQMTRRYMLKVLGRFDTERDWLNYSTRRTNSRARKGAMCGRFLPKTLIATRPVLLPLNRQFPAQNP